MLRINIKNMPHVKATLLSDHEIICEKEGVFIVYNKAANTYITEGDATTIIDIMKNLKIERLETSNKEVFDYFSRVGHFNYKQICLQCYHKSEKGKAILYLPTNKEMVWIAKTYGTTVKNIAKMRKNKEIFVYRKGQEAISYIGIHIDGSVGFLYTKPKYRKKGYATAIQKELFKIKKGLIFSQILENNKISIDMHKKNNWKFNRYKIYWLINETF